MKNLRDAIIRLFEQGKTGYQIAKDMNIGERMVYRTIKRYQETGSAKDKPRSGRPITARTPVNKRKIKGRIQRNPNSRKNSTRKMGKAIGISPRTVRRILHEDLGMKARKMKKAHGLTEKGKEKRLVRCKRLVVFFGALPFLLRLQRRFVGRRYRLILFTDEKWFDIEQSHNAQNDRQWSEEPLPLEERIVSRTQKPKQVMVWAAVGYGVKSPLFFVPAGVKVNGEEYREFLRT